MSLRNRLDTLRRESGAADDRAAEPRRPDSALAERLDRLRQGPAAGARVAPPAVPAAPLDHAELAQALGARTVAEGVLCVERSVALTAWPELAALAALPPGPGVMPGQSLPAPGRLLFLDTETSGLAGGAGTIAFMVGVLRLSGDAVVCRQYLLTGFAGEAAMYRAIAAEAAEVEAVVTYNGKSFDGPLLRDRACLLRQPSPLADLGHLDLLHPGRRLFGRVWPDCRLATAEAELLGFRRAGDLPGSEAPMAWFGFVHRGDWRPLAGVLEHNHHDLVSLARLLPCLVRGYADPLAHGAEPGAAARAWQAAGDEDRARSLLAEAGAALSRRDRLEYARLARRAGEIEVALSVWRSLAAQGDAAALEQLAKHYEHRALDWDAALACARQLDGDAAAARRRRLTLKRAARGGAQGELELGQR